MLVWLLMLLGIMVVWFILPDAFGEKKKKLIFLGLAFAIVVFVLGSRSEYAASSGDLYTYLKWYNRAIMYNTKTMLDFGILESGYILLNEILAWLVPWEYFIVYFQAAFCTGIMFWYIYRNVDDVFLGVIIYICLGPWQFFLTAFRQSIATCICFIALEFIKKRTTGYDVLGLCLIALASTVHTTAWLFLAVYVIRYFKPGKYMVIFSVITSVLMTQFVDELVSFGNETLGRDYASGEYFGNVFAGVIPILIYLATLILCYIAWRYEKEITEKYALDISILIFGLFLYTLRYNTHIFERISFYFTPVISVVLPASIAGQKNKTEIKVISAICVALCIGLYVYRAVNQFGEYSFYWE